MRYVVCFARFEIWIRIIDTAFDPIDHRFQSETML